VNRGEVWWVSKHCLRPLRVAGSPTPALMSGLATQNPLSYPVFQHTQEHGFGITLADVLPTLTGERE